MIILVGFGVSLLVFFVLFWFFSNTKHTLQEQEAAAIQASAMHAKNFTISSKDIETIAGDDVLTTQLDLARAYIETERKALAKNILNNVILQGSLEQQAEARGLMEKL
jgi:FimV-like protein